jgi:hypothetical protein
LAYSFSSKDIEPILDFLITQQESIEMLNQINYHLLNDKSKEKYVKILENSFTKIGFITAKDKSYRLLKELDLLKHDGKILEDGDVIHINTGEIESDMLDHKMFERIMDINLELASELDKDKLFDMILTLTRELTHCDGGTLYIISKDKKYLDFKVVQNKSLNIYMGGLKEEITWNSLPLYLENGQENKSMVAVVSALENSQYF